MSKRELIDTLPEDKFLLVVSLFTAHSDAVSFLQSVMSAHDHFRQARKALGTERANRLAAKFLSDLNREASEKIGASMAMQDAIVSALGMPVD